MSATLRALFALLPALALAGCASSGPSLPSAVPATPTPVPSPTSTVEPQPTPTPVPTRVPTVPPPSAMPSNDLDAPLIRVLLERLSGSVTLPQPGRAYRVHYEGRRAWIWGPLELSVAAAGAQWWQLGAWGDPDNVARVLDTVRRTYGAAVRVEDQQIRDGLTRVRVQWVRDEPADPQAALRDLGFEAARASGGEGSVRVRGANGAAVTASGLVGLEPSGEWPVAVGSKRYRGRLLARAVGSEILIINELNMESYLRGVVPVEMGPSQFPELNALKAQAIAARTYAVAHLGDHEDESWDLCDTPACQVYGGFDAEHRLSDRAVRESAGLIAVYDGAPIDAMYTSTCGGHTENVVELFESRGQPYLLGVPCAWERELALRGSAPDGDWIDATSFSAAAARRVLALEKDARPADVLRAAADRLGGRVEASPRLDLDSFSKALLAAAALKVPVGIAPPAAPLERLLFLADLYGAPLDPPVAGLTGSWAAAAALAALQLHGDVLRDGGEAVPRPGGTGIFPRRARHSQPLPSQLPLWERWHGAYRSRSRATVLPGTPLERVRAGDLVVALAFVSSGGAGEADRRSAWREWVRTRSWSELERMLGVDDLQRLTITRRSKSGRVVGLEAVSSTGGGTNWEGFDVREALELPETLFTMQLRSSADGGKEVRFLGRGWGHGVGLCQHGAYGLARVGMDFERILKHYYSGIEIVRWPGSSGR